MIYAHQYIFAGLAPGATCAGCPRSPAGEPGGMLSTGYDSLLGILYARQWSLAPDASRADASRLAAGEPGGMVMIAGLKHMLHAACRVCMQQGHDALLHMIRTQMPRAHTDAGSRLVPAPTQSSLPHVLWTSSCDRRGDALAGMLLCSADRQN